MLLNPSLEPGSAACLWPLSYDLQVWSDLTQSRCNDYDRTAARDWMEWMRGRGHMTLGWDAGPVTSLCQDTTRTRLNLYPGSLFSRRHTDRGEGGGGVYRCLERLWRREGGTWIFGIWTWPYGEKRNLGKMWRKVGVAHSSSKPWVTEVSNSLT